MEPSDDQAGRGRRVLIVDDNQDAAEILGEALTRLGHQVRVAFDARVAIGIAGEFVPDVALLDLGLPVMDGYQLALELRSVPGWKDVRLIALTGYAQDSDRERTRAAGFESHVVKPAEIRKVDELVRASPAP